MLNKEIKSPFKRTSLPAFETDFEEQEITPTEEIERVRLPRDSQVIYDVFNSKNRYNWDYVQFQGGSTRKRKGYVLSLWTWLAALIDGLILTSISCVFMIGFTVLMKSSLSEMIFKVHHDMPREFAVVFLLSSWIYMVATRGLMSSSVGEWACDLRLGQPHERFSRTYILRVVVRATLILATAIFPLPVLSLLFGRDVPGALCGLRLYSLK